jgi:hypothetical protein
MATALLIALLATPQDPAANAAPTQELPEVAAPEQAALPTAAAPQDSIPNAKLKAMYELRADRQRQQGRVALAIGGALSAGGLIGCLFLFSGADNRAFAIGLPWVLESGFWGFFGLLGGVFANGSGDHQKAEQLDPAGATSRAELFEQERLPNVKPGAVLGLAAGLGGTIAALGTTAVVLGGANRDSVAISAGAALVTFGMILAGLGLYAFLDIKNTRDQLDRGVLEDLDAVTVAPFAAPGGGGLGFALRF